MSVFGKLVYLLWLRLNKARPDVFTQMFYKNITIAVYGVLFYLIFLFKLLEFKLY